MNSLCTDIINSILIPYITVLYHKLFIPHSFLIPSAAPHLATLVTPLRDRPRPAGSARSAGYVVRKGV